MAASKFNRYFCQFLDLLDNPIDSFTCCNDPEIITLDGIVLSIDSSKIRRQNLKSPWIFGESNQRYVLFIEMLFYNRVSTRHGRSILNLSKVHCSYLEEYTGKEGLSADKRNELVATYFDNPCILLLDSICLTQSPPFKPPPAIKLFFQSIRKSVCPAISIAPKELWGCINSYIYDTTNSTTLENLVMLIN